MAADDLTPPCSAPLLDRHPLSKGRVRMVVHCSPEERLAIQASARRHGLSLGALVFRLMARQALPPDLTSAAGPLSRALVEELALLRPALDRACRLLLAVRDHDGGVPARLTPTLEAAVARACAGIDAVQASLMGVAP